MDNNSKLIVATASAALMVAILAYQLKKKRLESTRKRSVWCKKWIERRNANAGAGILKMINEEIRVEDPEVYKNFFRMDERLLHCLLSMIDESISRQDTNMRESIPAIQRLQITLRFLATGDSYKSLMYATRVHNSTIGIFVPEVCEAIYLALRDKYLKTPNTRAQWEQIADEFDDMWQFPNCIGALDGRHIQFRAALKDGSYYYNYKGQHSIVLLALADAKYRFTYVNVGTNGRVSDGGVFNQSQLAKAILNESLNLPPPRNLPGRSTEVPYVIIADDAFSLHNNLMKPYPKNLDHDRKIFNYRLSRARRMVESAFGLLANRFRVLLNPMHLHVDKVEKITLACVALHNFLIDEGDTRYAKHDDSIQMNSLKPLIKRGPNRKPTTTALKLRDEFKEYFVDNGKIAWQEDAINKFNM